MTQSKYSLMVDYKGNKNSVVHPLTGQAQDFPVGGVLCDFYRFDIKVLLDTVHKLDLLSETDISGKKYEILDALFEKLLPEFGVVATSLFMCDIDMYLPVVQEDIDRIFKVARLEDAAKIKDMVFQGSSYTDVGVADFRQAIMTALVAMLKMYLSLETMMEIAMIKGGDSTEQLLNVMMNQFSHLQHFEFNMLYGKDGFHSYYHIGSSTSLFMFELAHILENDVKLVKCENCGYFFVPIGRSDQKYCGYPSPKDSSKSCRDIGAQNTIIRKRKNDDVAAEQRKLYMRLMMRKKRHPEDTDVDSLLAEFNDKMKALRQQRDEGVVSSDDILEWLHQFGQNI